MYSYYLVTSLYKSHMKEIFSESKFADCWRFLKRHEVESYVISLTKFSKVYKVETGFMSRAIFKTKFFDSNFEIKEVEGCSIKEVEKGEDWQMIYHPLVGKEI